MFIIYNYNIKFAKNQAVATNKASDAIYVHGNKKHPATAEYFLWVARESNPEPYP